jgi:hypothetical protein
VPDECFSLVMVVYLREAFDRRIQQGSITEADLIQAVIDGAAKSRGSHENRNPA